MTLPALLALTTRCEPSDESTVAEAPDTSGTGSATRYTLQREGLPNQLIHFFVAEGGQELGEVRTNDQGKAVFDTGSHVSDPQLMVTAALSGYVAEFKGTRTYYSSEAKGRFNVSI